jgi:hypothetical protein
LKEVLFQIYWAWAIGCLIVQYVIHHIFAIGVRHLLEKKKQVYQAVLTVNQSIEYNPERFPVLKNKKIDGL